MFEPIAQVIFAPDRVTGYLNSNQNTSDSTTAEFEETNLFSTNRFPGFDEIESGFES
jgi:lipopolysaccharide assembly outer membrane protein LptD (OstA)